MQNQPNNMSDKIAYGLTMCFRWFADTFFAKRYGHRAVVLETVAGVPGMVAGMWTHLKSLRQLQTGYGPTIRTLLSEAENERMHLMIFMAIINPNRFERWLIIFAQFIFWHFYFFLYIFFPKIAHRMVGYFENQAVISYTHYLEEIDAGRTENIPAPKIAIDYYGLSPDAKLRDVVIAVRTDEQGHADVNHDMANQLAKN